MVFKSFILLLTSFYFGLNHRYNSTNQTFRFTGDDDVWVFINKRLAVDLGGTHGPLSGSVNVDNIASSFNLSMGNQYQLDIFQAERHTTGSNFGISTNINTLTSQSTNCTG